MDGNQYSSGVHSAANTAPDISQDDPEYMKRQFNLIQFAITRQRWYLVMDIINETSWELIHYSTSPTYDELLLQRYKVTALKELGRKDEAKAAMEIADELQRKLIVELTLAGKVEAVDQ